MEPHIWDRIQEVYYLALPLSATQRLDFVARECGFDPLLTREVCSLLEADESASQFLEPPVFERGLRIIDRDNRTPSPDVSEPADELVGSTIGERYVVGSPLAVGGMARVYVARDLRLHQRRVVVKVLLDESLRNEWVIQKFQQESEALARVNHPGVINILDTGELPDKKPYLVMEYVEGMSLREMIATNREGIDFPRAALIIRGIGAALNAVHQNGIYHRDLKPENIMVQRLGPAEDQVKVLDFGIAKVKESLIGPSTPTGAATMGTVAYMSPEQLRGDRVAAASDLYSFATIAFEMLTGRRPFVADTPAHLAEMQRHGVRAKPADLRPRLPNEAEAIILNGLAFEARARSLSVGEFGDRLSRVLLAGEDAGFLQQASSGMRPEAAGTPALATTMDSSHSPPASSSTARTPETTLISDGKTRQPRWLLVAVAAVLITGAMTGGYWLIFQNGGLFGKPVNSNSSAPHRTLTYSFTVQQMRDGLPFQDPYESLGQEIFESGYKFRLNVSSRQAGYLYVFNEGPPEKDHTAFTIIYPTPATKEGSRLQQNQKMQTNWNTFSGEKGTERFWIIWSATEVLPMEIARHEAFKNKEGAIIDSEVARNLRNFLSEHSFLAPETTKDTAKQRTNVRANGELLVKLVELEHR